MGYGFISQGPIEEGPAPDFTLSLFNSGELSLGELQGQVVVVNFWASWGVPCRSEADALERAWREYADSGVVFIGVNTNDVTVKAMAFIEEFAITYPNGPDAYGRIARAYRLTGVPETFFISEEGEVTERHIGAINEAELGVVLDRLLQP